MMGQERKFGMFYIFRVCAGMFICAASMASVLGVEIPAKGYSYPAAIVVVLLLMIWILLQFIKGKKRVLFLGFYVAFVAAAVSVFAISGIREVLECIGRIAASYYEGGVLESVKIEESELLGGLAILLLYGLVISYRGKWKVVRSMIHIPVLLFFLLPFLVGLSPGFHMEIGAVLYLGFVIIEETKKKLWAAAIVFGVGLVGSFVIYPFVQRGQSYMDDLQTWIRTEIFGEDREIVASGGVSDGKIGEVDRIEYRGFVDLTLILRDKPTDDIFLQGFVGSRYDNNEWKQQSGMEFGMQFSQSDARELKNITFEKAAEDAAEKVMEIEVNHASLKYQYMPYYSKYRRQDDLVRDGYVEGIKRDSRSSDVLFGGSTQEVKRQYNIDFVPMEDVRDVDTEEKSRLLREYENYVEDVYLDVPEYLREDLSDIAEEVGARNDIATINNIRDYLAEETNYTLSPGRTPKGWDAISYFLLENKEGYCVHYASAAVMLMRMNGIPARFVSGYKVSADAFEDTFVYMVNDNDYDFGYYSVSVLDSRAHAWPEYYLEGFGWVPVEVTPGIGAVESAVTSGPVQSPAQKPDSSGQNRNEKQSNEDSGETEKEETKKEETNTVKTYILYGVFASIILLILLKLHQLSMRNRWKAKKETGINEKVRLKFLESCELLRKSRLVREKENENAYWTIGAKLADVSEVRDLKEIVEKANFGRDNITKEEYINIERYLERLKKGVFTESSVLKRIKLRWWLGF